MGKYQHYNKWNAFKYTDMDAIITHIQSFQFIYALKQILVNVRAIEIGRIKESVTHKMVLLQIFIIH